MTIYSGRNGQDRLSVNSMLKQPDFIADLIAESLEISLASIVFGDRSTQATGGSVLYQRASATDLFTKDDIAERAEGAEYQIVRLPEPDIRQDPVEDLGGAFEVTDEAIERNVMDVVSNGIGNIGGSIRSALDKRIIATLDLATSPERTIVSDNDWGDFATTGATPTPRTQQPLADLVTIDETFREEGLGQILDTLLLSPADAAKLRIGYGPELQDMLASITTDPIKLRTSTAITPGTIYAMSQNPPGGLGIEKPLTTEVIEFRERRTTRVQTYIVCRPYISRLYAIRKLTLA